MSESRAVGMIYRVINLLDDDVFDERTRGQYTVAKTYSTGTDGLTSISAAHY